MVGVDAQACGGIYEESPSHAFGLACVSGYPFLLLKEFNAAFLSCWGELMISIRYVFVTQPQSHVDNTK